MMRCWCWIVVACVVGAGFVSGAGAAWQGEPRPGDDFDIRLTADPAGRRGVTLRDPGATRRRAAERLRSGVPGLVLRWDGFSGSPAWISAGPGEVLGPAGETAEDGARGFLLEHAALFGLTRAEIAALRVTSVVPGGEGGAHVHLSQFAGPLRVFGGGADLNLTPDFAVRSLGSALWSGAPAAAGAPALTACDALAIATREVHPELAADLPPVREGRTEGARETRFERSRFGRDPMARLVLFPTADGFLLAWEVEVAEASLVTDYVVVVDAEQGDVLYRANRTKHANARVLTEMRDPAGEETDPPQYQERTIPAVTAQSPAGWLSAPGTLLQGNNVVARELYHSQPPVESPSGDYVFRYGTLDAAATTAWWWVNELHDRFRALGFDEASGNFQQDNFGAGGLGGDPVQVVPYGSGGRTNAFMSTPDDGEPPVLGAFWIGCVCSEEDGYPENGGERHIAFELDVLVHEFVHGVSYRLVGGPSNPDLCLQGVQSGAMGEGWSDLMAGAMLPEEPSNGTHLNQGSGFTRDHRQDLGLGELCSVTSGCAVHYDGLIWSGALWDVRTSFLAADPAEGRTDFERLVVEGMKSTPCRPSMLDARDALLDADTALFGGSHQRAIWNAFASRDMGSGASTTGDNDTAPVTSTAVPAGMGCSSPGAPTGVSAAPDGPNAIVVSWTSGAPSVEVWREDLDVAWDRPARVGFSRTGSFRDLSVQGGRSYRYHTVALSDAGATCRSVASATADAVSSGSCTAFPRFDPGLGVADGAGCGLTLSWAPALPGCPGSGEAIVYSVYRANQPGLEPNDRLLLGRTSATSFTDVPPGDGGVFSYMVLAQHGSLSDPPDHRERGTSQVVRWVPRVPSTGRTLVSSWDFETGAQGWTTQNFFDPGGAWVVANPPHGTRYADAQFAPDAASGGTRAFVTGDGTSSTSIVQRDSAGQNRLLSPVFDGRNGATLFSFDAWCHLPMFGHLTLEVSNGSQTVSVTPILMQTVPSHDGPARLGWQRVELDLARYVAPTSTMRVTFVPAGYALSEYGIDTVRVERGTACVRPALELAGVVVDDTAPGWGNGNGVLDPGETARLTPTLRNAGQSTAFAPQATLVSRTRGILLHEDVASFPDLSPAATATPTAGPGYTVTLPGDLDCGDTPTLAFDVVEAAGTHVVLPWTPELGLTSTERIFTDTFETDLGWIAEGGGPGAGVWQRGNPVGTSVNGTPANPDADGPDPGASCLVTENGAAGGAANATDVDVLSSVSVYSPALDLRPFKRARVLFDLWYFDTSSSTPDEDYGAWGVYVDEGARPPYALWSSTTGTGAWQASTQDLTGWVPFVDAVRLYWRAFDQALDHTVEMGLDHVRVDADRFTCAPATATHVPGEIRTLRVDRNGDALSLSWSAPEPDATHGPAAWYRLWNAAAPMGAWSEADTTTSTAHELALPAGSAYLLVSSVNAVGASDDEPLP